jgi:HAD superfamily hydrolase (TIGR01662 family)
VRAARHRSRSGDVRCVGCRGLVAAGLGKRRVRLRDLRRLHAADYRGRGPQVLDAAREIYQEWAACHHFSLYEEVPEVLRALHAEGYMIGLISNTHRSLETFESHFELHGLFSVAISSSDHGYMKPHPSIFEEGLRRMAVQASEAVMVGDSVRHDIEGARRLGMRGILVARSGLSQSLRELRNLL